MRYSGSNVRLLMVFAGNPEGGFTDMNTSAVKKLSAISFVITLFVLCASSPAALVHYWSLDDSTLADEGLGHGSYGPHAAQLIDPHSLYTPPTPCAGKLKGGYDLGSTNPLVYSDILIGGNNIVNSSVLDGTFPSPPITVSMWFYPTMAPPASGVWYLLGNYFANANQDRFYLSLGGNASGAAGILFSIGNTKDWNKGADPFTIPVTLNTWHHIMMKVEDAPNYEAKVTLVLDGGTPTVITTTAGHSGPDLVYFFDRGNKRVGTNGNQLETGKTFHGYVDDVAIWNEALPTPSTGFNAASFLWNSGTGRAASVADGKRAYDPTPANRGEVSSITQLKWYNAQRLTSSVTCDVYMSTSRADLVNSSNVPLFPSAYKVASGVAGTAGSQSSASVTAPEDTTYYWMVSTKSSNPGDPNNVNGYAGPVWRFDKLSNVLPEVDAGLDRFTYVGAGTIQITGTVEDDGKPVGANVTCTWKDSGGTPIATNVVKNGNIYTCTATVTVGSLDSVTTYTLEANDTTGSTSDTMKVFVKSTPCTAAQFDPTYSKNAADINDDCAVTFKDFALMVAKWRVCTALDSNCN